MRGRRVYSVSTGFRSSPVVFTNALYAVAFAGGPDRDMARDAELVTALRRGLGVTMRRHGGWRDVRRLVLH